MEGNKILIVVDVQNDFVTGALGSEEAKSIVPNVVQKMKSYKDDVLVFTRDTHYEGYLDTEEGKNLPVPHCIFHTDGWQVVDEVVDAHHGRFCHIIDKETFGSVNVAHAIRAYRPAEIELVGLCTDICVVSNALLLKAFYPDARIYVDASCCAGTSPEAHDAAIRTMESCQVHILNKGKESWRA